LIMNLRSGISLLLCVFILWNISAVTYADDYASVQAALALPVCSSMSPVTPWVRQVASGTPVDYTWRDAWENGTAYEVLVLPVNTGPLPGQPAPNWRYLYDVTLSNGNEVRFGMMGDQVEYPVVELASDGSRTITGSKTTVTKTKTGVYNVLLVRTEGGLKCRSEILWVIVDEKPVDAAAPTGLPLQPVVVPPPCTVAMTGSPFVGPAQTIPAPDYTGSACNDNIHGEGSANNIDGGDGDDTIMGYGAGDTLNGDAGNDTLDGGDGNDTLNGADGNDTLNGGNQNDILIDPAGTDVLNGGDGDDSFQAAGGGDTLNGGAGQDVWLIGSVLPGNDWTVNDTGGSGTATSVSGTETFTSMEAISTGSGNDTFNLGGTGGADATTSHSMNADTGSNVFNFMTGVTGYWTVTSNGTETLNFGALGAGVNVNMTNSATHQDVYGDSSFWLLLQGVFDHVVGTAFNDTITGNTANNTISGGGGSDIINGGDGVDTLDGGAGDDTINGDAGNDIIQVSTGTDTVNGGTGDDQLDGTTGNDAIVINGTNQGTVNGTTTFTGVENVNGGNGDDTFTRTDGEITGQIDGGIGNDTFSVQSTGVTATVFTVSGANSGVATVNDLLPTDFVGMENLTGGIDDANLFNLQNAGSVSGALTGNGANSYLGYYERTTAVSVDLASGTATDVGSYTGIYNAQGGSANDTLLGDGNANNLWGGGGCDTLDGAAGTDNVYGGWNNVTGFNRNDTCGDTIFDTDTSADTLYGGNFNQGGTGDDLGTDTFNISSAGTIAYGGNRNQSGAGTNDDGNDIFYAGLGTTGLIAGGNLNTGAAITGNDGDDTIQLLAGSGAVTVYAGNDNQGGRGTDGSDTVTDDNAVSNLIFGGNRNASGICTLPSCADNGNDSLTDNSTGSDGLFGGNSNGVGSRGNDTGNDTITLNVGTVGTGYGGNLNQGAGSAGNDDGNDTLTVTNAVNLTLYGGNLNFQGGTGIDGNDTLNDNSTGANLILGGNRNDTSGCTTALAGFCSDGSDTINDNAAGGTDTLFGGNHNFATGDAGNDSGDTINLTVTSSASTVRGGNFNQDGAGTDGADTINDDNGAANGIAGGNYNANTNCTNTSCSDGGDTINDGAPVDANVIYGGNVNIAGGGNDGADTINVADGDFADTVLPGNDGGTGADAGATTIADSGVAGAQ
jgi:hypothetical protein